ncbi:hypothetical protein F5X96DRAFT_671952 [Biscogniauxia mediterranea]|nr:hypothetical protein F5X96DRAFT_671952 [Biscogniauxia mediterranea]
MASSPDVSRTHKLYYRIVQGTTTTCDAGEFFLNPYGSYGPDFVTDPDLLDGHTVHKYRRWAWLVLPTVLLALSVLFLAAAAAAFVETRRTRIGMWQSSPLTLFLHAPDREDSEACLLRHDRGLSPPKNGPS